MAYLALFWPFRKRHGRAKVFEVWHSRRDLARLGPHILRDIGLSEKEAMAEARRPMWDLRGCRRR